MMVTGDIRLERLKKEYGSLRETQDNIINKVDDLGTWIQRLEASVKENGQNADGNLDLSMDIHRLIMDSQNLTLGIQNLILDIQKLILDNQKITIGNQKPSRDSGEMLRELIDMVQAIIVHLGVAYEPIASNPDTQ